MKKRFNLLATAVLSVLATSSAQAIQFDGFMTAGGSIHDDSDNKNIYIGSLGDRGITNDLTFETDSIRSHFRGQILGGTLKLVCLKLVWGGSFNPAQTSLSRPPQWRVPH